MKASNASHIIAFAESSIKNLQPGDKIILSGKPDGSLVEVTIKNIETPIAFPIFMDDITTLEKDGFESGESFGFYVQRGKTQVPVEASIDFNFDCPDFKTNGMSLVKSLNFNTTILNDDPGISLQFYPNPSKNILYFNGIDQESKIKIYTSQGSLIYDNQINNAQLDVGTFDAGIYYVYIYQDDISIVKKFVKQ
jgi:hypothetical protein